MTRTRVANRGFIPAPVSGLDFRVPVFNMPPEYSPFMLNFYNVNGRLKKRDAHTTAVTSTTPATDIVIAVPPTYGGSTRPIIVGETTTDNGSTSSATPAQLHPLHDWTSFRETLFFGARSEIYTLNVSTLAWTNTFGYSGTLPSSDTQRRPLVAYRERMYAGYGFDLNYGGVGAITGTMTAFSVQNLINGVGIVGLGNFSAEVGLNVDQFLVIVSSKGEVLIYSGSYPGGTDWNLVSKFELYFPAGSTDLPCEVISIPNDVLISAKFGYQLYSVRELLQTGRGAAQFSLMEPLRPLFELADPTSDATYGERVCVKSVAYWAQANALVVGVDFTTDKLLYLEDWNSYISGGFSSGDGTLLFLIDLSDGTITMHDIGDKVMTGQIRAAPNYVLCPDVDKGLKLFDGVTSTPYQDYGSTDYNAIVSFAPLYGDMYKNQALKNFLLYSNLTSSHTLQHGMKKNFATGPANFTTFATAETGTDSKQHVLPGSQMGASIIPQLKESGHHTTALEIYGANAIFESGGEY